MTQVSQKIQHCPECVKVSSAENDLPPLPDYPWQVVVTNIFELQGDKYILIIDYSRFPEIVKPTTTTS